jgi:hypothetical protein
MDVPVAHFDKCVAYKSGMKGAGTLVVDCLADLLEVKSKPVPLMITGNHHAQTDHCRF